MKKKKKPQKVSQYRGKRKEEGTRQRNKILKAKPQSPKTLREKKKELDRGNQRGIQKST